MPQSVLCRKHGSIRVAAEVLVAVCPRRNGDMSKAYFNKSKDFPPLKDRTETQFPEDIQPEVGQTFELQSPQGNLPVRVMEINEEGVLLDGNHPLAGEDLTFELTLVEVA